MQSFWLDSTFGRISSHVDYDNMLGREEIWIYPVLLHRGNFNCKYIKKQNNYIIILH